MKIRIEDCHNRLGSLGLILHPFANLLALFFLAGLLGCSENGYILATHPKEEKTSKFTISPKSIDLDDYDTLVTITGKGFGKEREEIEIYFGDEWVDEDSIKSISDTKVVLWPPEADHEGFVDVKIILTDGSTVLLEKGFEYRNPIGPEECDELGAEDQMECTNEIDKATSAWQTRVCQSDLTWPDWEDVTCLVDDDGCESGYEPNANNTACDPKTSCEPGTEEEQGCDEIENGTGKMIRVCQDDGTYPPWEDSTCEVKTCNLGYHEEDGMCDDDDDDGGGGGGNNSPPAITSLSPNSGVASGGRKFEINGSNFSENQIRVKFGETNITTACNFIDESKVKCETPKFADYAAPTEMAVQVVHKKNGNVVSESNVIHYTYDNTPKLNEIRLRNATTSQTEFLPEDEIDLIGERFAAIKNIAVLFKSINAVNEANCDSVNEFGTKLKCKVPKNLETGAWEVYTEHTFLSFPQTKSNSLEIQVVTKDDLSPQIDGISPTSGVSEGGNKVVISGKNFFHAKVYFGSEAVPDGDCEIKKTNTELTCKVPKLKGYTGPTQVAVTVKNKQTAEISNSKSYSYDNVPVVDRISDPNGNEVTEFPKGTRIRVEGKNFASLTEVKMKFQKGTNEPKDGTNCKFDDHRTVLICTVPNFENGSKVNVWIRNNFSGTNLETTNSTTTEITIVGNSN